MAPPKDYIFVYRTERNVLVSRTVTPDVVDGEIVGAMLDEERRPNAVIRRDRKMQTYLDAPGKYVIYAILPTGRYEGPFCGAAISDLETQKPVLIETVFAGTHVDSTTLLARFCHDAIAGWQSVQTAPHMSRSMTYINDLDGTWHRRQ